MIGRIDTEDANLARARVELIVIRAMTNEVEEAVKCGRIHDALALLDQMNTYDIRNCLSAVLEIRTAKAVEGTEAKA